MGIQRFSRATDGVPGYAPYQVQMLNSTTNHHMCCGAIINAFFILTAAHCLIRPRTGSSKEYRNASEILIVAGKYQRNGSGFSLWIRHNSNLSWPFIPVSGYIAGVHPSNYKYFRVCQAPQPIISDVMCAVSKKTALCPGDSGSPVVCQDDSLPISSLPLGRQPSRDILCGIVSWGGPLVECMAHWNGSFHSEPWAQVFTKVSHFSDWVSRAIQGRKIKSHFLCKSELQYVYKFEKCDSYVDCDDGSDEMNCKIHLQHDGNKTGDANSTVTENPTTTQRIPTTTITGNNPTTTTPAPEDDPTRTTPITKNYLKTTTQITKNDPTTTTPITKNDPTTNTPITKNDPTTNTPVTEDDLATTTTNVARTTPAYEIIDLDDFDLTFSNWRD
ncbi:serine protease nudel-like [Folsomia candida]|uniref:serine protease nudel-like n=1 Tax=Folsomia candida TaxID=158441 RepID=UPI0016053F53|nr:serine protease nudel-like [Folsomia candida]